ncbi:MAG: ribose-phosphate diphosphokinase [Spirochaetales bacterium]|nr:ribose-phosphate diphosphokinase [Spirochaetales bacterium]
MTFNRSTTLGILACPGGKAFAGEVISHLKYIYHRRFEKKVGSLSRVYNLPKEEITRQMNFDYDLHSNEGEHEGSVYAYRPPHFVVPANFTRFANGEFKTEIGSSIRGMDLFIIQDIANLYPVKFHNSDDRFVLSINDHMICLMTAVDAAIQAGAVSVTVVVPSYPYARQHKKKGREGLTAARFGQIMENMGVERIMTLDIHSKEIENTFVKLNLENLHASYQILTRLHSLIDLKDPNLVIVSPDTGAVDRNKFYASCLNRSLAMLYKERDYSKLSVNAGESNITDTKLLGDVQGKNVFMADDLLGTGGTLIKAFKLLTEMGAKKIIAGISLPLFTGEAIHYFDQAYEQGLFHRIIGTNAVYHDERLLDRPWYTSANVSNLFARAISRLHDNRSLSSLLDNAQIIRKLMES